VLHLRGDGVGLLALLPRQAVGRLRLQLRLAVHRFNINSFVRQNFLSRFRVAEGVTPSSRRLLGESCRGGGVALLELEARAAARWRGGRAPRRVGVEELGHGGFASLL